MITGQFVLYLLYNAGALGMIHGVSHFALSLMISQMQQVTVHMFDFAD